VLHLRLRLVLNNCPSENDSALIALVNRPSGYSSQSRWDELSKNLRLKKLTVRHCALESGFTVEP
jgi:hypothetical protein